VTIIDFWLKNGHFRNKLPYNLLQKQPRRSSNTYSVIWRCFLANQAIKPLQKRYGGLQWAFNRATPCPKKYSSPCFTLCVLQCYTLFAHWRSCLVMRNVCSGKISGLQQYLEWIGSKTSDFHVKIRVFHSKWGGWGKLASPRSIPDAYICTLGSFPG